MIKGILERASRCSATLILQSIACVGTIGAAHGSQVDARIINAAGGGVSDAVVALYSTDTSSTSAAAASPSLTNIDQVHKRFVPHVLAIHTGTAISFPNSDNIRHHVYSFSEAKRFELKLYSGRPANPIVMDRAGVVVLGCNIHDWMRGYVYVLDTRYFAVTDSNGHAVIGVPPGDYTVKIWHPQHEAGYVPLQKSVHVERERESLQEVIGLDPIGDSSGVPPSTTAADRPATQAQAP